MDKYTEEALSLDKEARDVLRPIFDRWIEKGFSSIEIEYVLEWSVKECGMRERASKVCGLKKK